MTNQSSPHRKSLCSVERGLYVIRYRSAPSGSAPLAHLRVVAGPVAFVTAPGRTSAHLASRGDAIVLVADAPGIVEIGLDVVAGAVLPEVYFTLDLLDRGIEGAQAPECLAATPRLSREEIGEPPHLFRIEAHVSRVGDVRVEPGAWIAGPDLPLPIEGLTVLEGRSPLGLELQVRSAARSRGWSPWAGAGQLAGTRRCAEHLTGVRIKLGDARRSGQVIAAEALFLGASVVRQQGEVVEFASDDPLVGLRFDLARDGMPPGADGSSQERRVKVFRAH